MLKVLGYTEEKLVLSSQLSSGYYVCEIKYGYVASRVAHPEGLAPQTFDASVCKE
jgi:hypothetical protein